jgi:hypothetical protein
MVLARSTVLSIAVLVLALAGCDQSTVETQAPDTAPAPVAEAEPAAPPAEPVPAAIPPLTELPVNSVDSVMLSRPQDAPGAMIIRVLGTAASNGWSLPKLEPMVEEGSDASIVSYKFVATSPEAASDDPNPTPEQIETELLVDSLPAEVMTIRIVSATNEVSAPVAQ